MRGRSQLIRDYGWAEAERDLARGIHPEVVAARLGEPIDYVLEVADQQGWPIRWQPHETPTDAIDRLNRQLGLDA